MKCEVCGKPFTPSGRGLRQKYCSADCRRKAWRLRHANPESKPEQAEPPEPSKRGKSGRVLVNVSPSVDAEISKADFDRMMDDSYDDLLRFSRDVLKKALTDGMTPNNAKAGIVKELLEVGKEIEQRVSADGDDLLSFDGGEVVADEFRAETV